VAGTLRALRERGRERELSCTQPQGWGAGGRGESGHGGVEMTVHATKWQHFPITLLLKNQSGLNTSILTEFVHDFRNALQYFQKWISNSEKPCSKCP
jgi:hypothetical protein